MPSDIKEIKSYEYAGKLYRSRAEAVNARLQQELFDLLQTGEGTKIPSQEVRSTVIRWMMENATKLQIIFADTSLQTYDKETVR